MKSSNKTTSGGEWLPPFTPPASRRKTANDSRRGQAVPAHHFIGRPDEAVIDWCGSIVGVSAPTFFRDLLAITALMVSIFGPLAYFGRYV